MSGHVVRGTVVITVTGGKPALAALCSCGWQGPARHGSMGLRRAQNDAEQHLDDVREA